MKHFNSWSHFLNFSPTDLIMLNIYKGKSRIECGTKSENARFDELFDIVALITSQATLHIASRASFIDDVTDRSAAKSNICVELKK
jgi:hypothetical protein